MLMGSLTGFTDDSRPINQVDDDAIHGTIFCAFSDENYARSHVIPFFGQKASSFYGQNSLRTVLLAALANQSRPDPSKFLVTSGSLQNY
jgi:hypothetical protein